MAKRFMNSPKGCPSSRGASDIKHISSQGGGLARETNRLYMLSVRRESMMNKKSILESRLGEVNRLLKGIDTDIKTTEKQYHKLQGRRSSSKKIIDNQYSSNTVELKF